MYYLLSNLLQITSTRRTWKATKEKLMAEEEIALLQHQLISTQSQSQSPSTIIYEIIRNIDGDIKNLIGTSKVSQTIDSLSYIRLSTKFWRFFQKFYFCFFHFKSATSFQIYIYRYYLTLVGNVWAKT